MKKIILPLAVSIPLLVSGAWAADVKVKLINKSSFEIHEMYVSPTKQNEWGPDQLRDEIIKKNGSFELHGIPVGKYDFKIVDEDGDACVIDAVKVAADEDVKFDDALLVGCQAATEDEESDEAE